jgi:hypothetical protein
MILRHPASGRPVPALGRKVRDVARDQWDRITPSRFQWSGRH